MFKLFTMNPSLALATVQYNHHTILVLYKVSHQQCKNVSVLARMMTIFHLNRQFLFTTNCVNQHERVNNTTCPKPQCIVSKTIVVLIQLLWQTATYFDTVLPLCLLGLGLQLVMMMETMTVEVTVTAVVALTAVVAQTALGNTLTTFFLMYSTVLLFVVSSEVVVLLLWILTPCGRKINVYQ